LNEAQRARADDFPSCEPKRILLMARAPKIKARKSATSGTNDGGAVVLDQHNYVLLGVSVAMIVGGFTAMALENSFQGFISLFIAPPVILAGYLLVIWAILDRKRPEA